ncbi:MAG: histone deacetylase family protein, partial [Deltaproteobacteria bacterium]|nr:histone deacetylase family protein [Deltaproteobacteria bacterium]
MQVVFHQAFYNSDYADNNASMPGRMEAVMSAFSSTYLYKIIPAAPAAEEDILRAHTERRLQEVRRDPNLYSISMLAAGAAITAAESAYFSNTPVFACLRPPGHHASKDSTWGFCVFCNIAVALLRLKARGLIRNAVVLDFDAHTGDGTIDTLKSWPEATIINIYAENNKDYMKQLEDRLREVRNVDIVAVSAGFDTYIHDVGRKLEIADFRQIGYLLKNLSQRMGHD